MSWTLVDKVAAGAGATNVTTGAITTTPATVLTAFVSSYQNAVNAVGAGVSDSKFNVWIPLPDYGQTQRHSGFYYCLNPTVGAGHTFTFTGLGDEIAVTIQVQAWAGSSPAFDHEDGKLAPSSGASLVMNAFTPLHASTLIVAGLTNLSSTTGTPDSGFTVANNPLSLGLADAYLVQGSPAAVTLTWTFTGSNDQASGAMAAFYEASLDMSAVSVSRPQRLRPAIFKPGLAR